MAETYTLHVAGLTRELTICKVNDIWTLLRSSCWEMPS